MGLASNSSDRGLQRPARCWGPRRGSCERDQRSNGRSDAARGEIAWAPCFACSRLRGPDQVGGLAAPDDPRSSVSELPCPHSLMRSPATHLGVCMHDCPASCPCHPHCFHVWSYTLGAGAGSPTGTRDTQGPEQGSPAAGRPACKLHAQHAAAGGAHCVARRRGCCLQERAAAYFLLSVAAVTPCGTSRGEQPQQGLVCRT